MLALVKEDAQSALNSSKELMSTKITVEAVLGRNRKKVHPSHLEAICLPTLGKRVIRFSNVLKEKKKKSF